MKLPKIGDTITVLQGLELCRHFNLNYLAERIITNPRNYRPWEFDGCSGVDDHRVLKFIFGDKWRKITFDCCLKHDLKYAYGDIDSKAERKAADDSFNICLQISAKLKGWQARIFYRAVRIFGGRLLKAPFSWGFGHR